MDIYNLINSKTISKYCRKIKHQFNTLETSILICRCKTITIEKKIAYYNEMINNPTLYPNMEVNNQLHIADTTAIDLIKREVDMLNFSLDMFHKPDENAVFALRTSYSGQFVENEKWKEDRIFKTLHDVSDYIEKKVVTDKNNKAYKISKKHLNTDYKYVSLTYRRNNASNFELFDIDNNTHWEYGHEDIDCIYWDGIGSLWLNVPTPFKKGDIITNGERKAVIDWVCNKDAEYVQHVEAGNGDSSDMQYHCYIINYYGGDKRRVYLENMFDYDEFEYCTEELKGFDRVLKTISSLITNKIKVNLFLDASNFIKAEEVVAEADDLSSWYTDEGLQLVGLNEEDKQ